MAMRFRTLRLCSAAICLLTGAPYAFAQKSAAADYPTRPIRIMVPFSAWEVDGLIRRQMGAVAKLAKAVEVKQP